MGVLICVGFLNFGVGKVMVVVLGIVWFVVLC